MPQRSRRKLAQQLRTMQPDLNVPYLLQAEGSFLQKPFGLAALARKGKKSLPERQSLHQMEPQAPGAQTPKKPISVRRLPLTEAATNGLAASAGSR